MLGFLCGGDACGQMFSVISSNTNTSQCCIDPVLAVLCLDMFESCEIRVVFDAFGVHALAKQILPINEGRQIIGLAPFRAAITIVETNDVVDCTDGRVSQLARILSHEIVGLGPSYFRTCAY